MRIFISVFIAALLVTACNKPNINSIKGTSDLDKKILIDALFSGKKKMKIKKSELTIGEKCVYDEYFSFSDVSTEENILKGTLTYNQEEVFIMMLAGISSIKDDASCTKYKEDMAKQVKSTKTKETINIYVNLSTGEVIQKKVSGNKG